MDKVSTFIFVPEQHNSDDFTQSTLSLGSAGTRRTVYYTGEDNETQESQHDQYVRRTKLNL